MALRRGLPNLWHSLVYRGPWICIDLVKLMFSTPHSHISREIDCVYDTYICVCVCTYVYIYVELKQLFMISA